MASARDPSEPSTDAIALGPRMARSSRFGELFDEGIRLVEEAAGYLDGPGRLEAADLSPSLAGAYAAESMRLTSRLMQLASWLMLRRALERGEVSDTEAAASRVKVVTQGSPTPRGTFLQLPLPLQRLTMRSFELQRRVVHLDQMVSASPTDQAAPSPTAPAEQQALLRSAFGTPDP